MTSARVSFTLVSLSFATTAAAAVPGADPDWTWEGDEPGVGDGYTVAGLGDLDGDGHDDIGSIGVDGMVQVFYGTADGPSSFADWALQTTELYSAIAGGDWNGDGLSDLAVSCALCASTGTVSIYFGTEAGISTVPSWTFTGTTSYLLGSALDSAGDVNGDGFEDLLVGAPYSSSGGEVYLFFGSAVGPDGAPNWTGTAVGGITRFGVAVAGLGDVNGDGFDDVAIGESEMSNGNSLEGRVNVYYGRASGLRSTPHKTYEVDQDDAAFGERVDGCDLNGDGYGDLVATSRNYTNGSTQEGRAVAWFGSASGLKSAASWIVDGNQEYASLFPAACAGDLNGDGFDDLAVGVPYWDDTSGDQGAVRLYLGGTEGPSVYADWTVVGAPNARLGWAVATAGDTNGDGVDDLLAGAYGYTDGEALEGRVQLWLGISDGEITPTSADFEVPRGASADPRLAEAQHDAVGGCSSTGGPVGGVAALLALTLIRRRPR